MAPNTIEVTIKDLRNMVRKIGISNPSALSSNELLDVVNMYQQNTRQHIIFVKVLEI